ncbi:MAG: YhbY family RNA-binding protein [Pseudomonadales bacterium]|nr:YhbY family RNA-binding protein [Pseudomonadales bacterium]
MTSKAELKRFRAIGHKLKPNVTIAGKGLSESVVSEIKRSLADHELIKVRVNTDDRKDRDETIASIVEQTTSSVIQTIGNVALLYKAGKKPNPKLSNILRSELL